VKLFKTLVHLTFEYGNSIWGLNFILIQRKIENIQCRATCLILFVRNNSYSERLAILDLPSMYYRQIRGDIILMYKIVNNYFNSDFSHFQQAYATRGHNFKLFKYHSRLQLCMNFLTELSITGMPYH